MPTRPSRILLTGLPGCGKTTAVMRIISRLNPEKVSGFFTQEIRESGVRKGFKWRLLDGKEGTLAHIDIKSPFRVGKYKVDIERFDSCVVPLLDITRRDIQLFVIDEVGKMECLSGKFIDAVRRIFGSDRSVLATVARKGSGFICELKKLPDVKLFTLTAHNSDRTISEVLKTLCVHKI